MSHFRVFAPLLGLVALAATPGCAATGPATPDNVNAVIAGARAGDVIRLTPGNYGQIVVKGKEWKPALVIEAGDAVIDRVTLEAVTGLHWRGGRPGAAGSCATWAASAAPWCRRWISSARAR